MRSGTRHPLRPMVFAIVALISMVTVLVQPSTQSDAAPATLKGAVRDGLAVGGAASGYDRRWATPGYGAVASREFNAMTSMSYMAYNGWLNPNSPIDTLGHRRMVSWSVGRNKKVHGHVLVYPAANRDLAWYQDPNIDHEAVLKTYVETMARSTRNRVWVWDVVNEVMADTGDDRVDEWGLRNDYIEHVSIGADYVDKAFRWAKAADPRALLIINDYGAEEINDKSDRLLRYVTELRRRGVPIDGVGFQMHIFGTQEPDYDSIRANFQRFADAGFKLFITEMDVSAHLSPSEFPLPTVCDLDRQSLIYENIARIATEQPAVESLLLWDFADERSWLNPTDRPLGDIPIGTWTYPTPFFGGRTERPSPKPAYFGLLEGLSSRSESPPSRLQPGSYRLEAAWGGGYLTRLGVPDGSGGYVPSDEVRLQDLDASWSSQVWTVEDNGQGSWWLSNQWADNTGTLGRRGIPDGNGDYRPGPELQLLGLNTSWSSQSWALEAVGDGTYRLRNGWDGPTGYLTRNGTAPNGGQPTSEAGVQSCASDHPGQRWYVRPAG